VNVDLPRLRLAALPTPLHRLHRFGEAIGAEVWIKRDDVGSIGLAGNKVRKLEYTLADAQAQGADAIVIIGAPQSNASRATAAACAQLGLRCVLVLSSDPPDGPPSGNLLLDELFGAEVHFAGEVGWAELAAASQEISDDLRAQGATPYLLPAGSSSPLGAVGFATAWFELREQLDEAGVDARSLFYASSSGGTHAGLLLGKAIDGGSGPELRAIDVAPNLAPDIDAIARGAAALMGVTPDLPPAQVDPGFVGDGYAIPTDDGIAAIRLLARTEAILCDPIYSGKALAALVAAEHDGPVVFWHTGGYHALFAPRYGAAVAGA
jgi:1-aminocyclopropane-1-carboxylate deaminase/D-cysteine desulfhydrase-like pyridoxal-dependent ACC family enzyme